MRVSEMIVVLQDYLRTHGDHELVDAYDAPIEEPEEVEGVCVLAERA